MVLPRRRKAWETPCASHRFDAKESDPRVGTRAQQADSARAVSRRRCPDAGNPTPARVAVTRRSEAAAVRRSCEAPRSSRGFALVTLRRVVGVATVFRHSPASTPAGHLARCVIHIAGLQASKHLDLPPKLPPTGRRQPIPGLAENLRQSPGPPLTPTRAPSEQITSVSSTREQREPCLRQYR